MFSAYRSILMHRNDAKCDKCFCSVVPTNHFFICQSDRHGFICSITSSDIYFPFSFPMACSEIAKKQCGWWARGYNTDCAIFSSFSNHQLLLSKCNNHQEGGIEALTFDLILSRSVTASLVSGFYVLHVT